MVLLTLARTKRLTSVSIAGPYTYAYAFSYETADYWTSVFGAPHDVVSESLTITDVFVDYLKLYGTSSLALCYDTEGSWFFDGDILFIHFDHATIPESSIIQYGVGQGFCDTGVVYISGVQYIPLLKDFPSIKRDQDIQGYDRLSLLSATASLINVNGQVDYLKDEPIIGNSALVSYADNQDVIDGMLDPSKAIPQAFYFVDGVDFGVNEVKISLQDTRDVQKKVPFNEFKVSDYPYLDDANVGKLIPLVYGRCRGLKAIPVTTKQTGTTSATYRISEVMTSVISVLVKIDDTWTARTPSSTDLATGTIVVPNAREAVDKAPYECQVEGIGISVANAPDIIVDLYDRALDQPFNDQFYDVTQWQSASAELPPCSIAIYDSEDILDIIPKIQNGVSPGFRFDITYDGRKTIKIDDRTKAVSAIIPSLHVGNVMDLTSESTADNLAGEIVVKYAKSYTSGEYYRSINTDNDVHVQEDYQLTRTIERETLLVDDTDADAMALYIANDAKDPLKTISVELLGGQYVGLEIFDVIQVDLTPGRLETYTDSFSDREYYGVTVGQIVSTEPNYSVLSNTVGLRILQDRTPYLEENIILVTDYVANFLTAESGEQLVSEDVIPLIGDETDGSENILICENGLLLIGG